VSVPYSSRWTRAWGGPAVSGRIRAAPEHFRVQEELNHVPDREGEHFYVHVEKRERNTLGVAKRLAAFCGVRSPDVGFAGMKDRHAVTRQWFSVGPAGRSEPDWTSFDDEAVKILEVTRHGRKLRRGAVRRNRFELAITDVQGDTDRLSEQLERVSAEGVPNYFGEQRFGQRGRNIEKALALFAGGRRGRAPRSIYISAARAWLFNEVLSARIDNDIWRRVQAGDVMMLAGSRSVFSAPADEVDVLQARRDRHEIELTGPLAGAGERLSSDGPARLEQQVFDNNPRLFEGLIEAGLKADRRPLCVVPGDPDWRLEGDRLSLSFNLPAGAYATAVLREIVEYSQGE
jgi:tRNA pseudouridine13 synthase